MAEEQKTRETTREIKSKHTALTSNLTFGTFLTTLFFYVFPDIPEEFVAYVPIGIVGGLAWLGATARDKVHAWKTDPAVKVKWWVPALVRLLG